MNVFSKTTRINEDNEEETGYQFTLFWPFMIGFIIYRIGYWAASTQVGF